MSKKSDGLLADMLSNRWSYTSTATNATLTPEVVAAPQSAKEQRHMDFFYLSFLSKNTLSFTIAAQVRDASVAGTILAQFPFIIGASQVAQVAMSDIHLVATNGKGFFITTDTAQPSVTATCNAAGWTDSSHD